MRRLGSTSSAAPAKSPLAGLATTHPVTLYSTKACEACDDARRLLNERGIPFREMSINDEQELELLKQAVGGSSVPALVVGDVIQRGYEPRSYHRTLDAAGYPKTGVLPPRNQAEPKESGRMNEPMEDSEPPQRPAGPYAPGNTKGTSTRK